MFFRLMLRISTTSIKIWAACVMSLLTQTAFPQEIPLSQLPPSITKPVPAEIMYTMFLHHVLAFEKAASAQEEKGLSGEAFRNHLQHKFGFDGVDGARLAALATLYDSEAKNLKAQKEAIVKQYRASNFINGKQAIHGMPYPTPPPDLKALTQAANNLALKYRDQIHASLGDAKFKQLEQHLKQHFFNVNALN